MDNGMEKKVRNYTGVYNFKIKQETTKPLTQTMTVCMCYNTYMSQFYHVCVHVMNYFISSSRSSLHFYKLHVISNPQFDTNTITRVANIWVVAVDDKQSYI